MKNKDKKKSSNIFQSSKKINNLYTGTYDLNDIMVLAVDGCLVHVDQEQGRLIFFHSIPTLSLNNCKNEKKLNKCTIELRMTSTTLKIINEIIRLEIQACENEQHCCKKKDFKNKNLENFMFG